MKTPLVMAALGMAAAYYLCSGFAALPAVFALCLAGACVLASVAIAFSCPRFQEKDKVARGRKKRVFRAGGFPARILLFCAAAGVFAGGLVYRYSIQRRAASYFGFAASGCAAFLCTVRGDSWVSGNGNIIAPVHIEAARDARGNSAGADAEARILFGKEASRAEAPGPPPGELSAGRLFLGEKLLVSGSLSQAQDGGFFLLAAAAEPSGGVLPFFAYRKNLLLKIETLITSFKARPFRGAWPGLFTALLLGNQEYLDTQLAERFRQAGAVHVLALSGMHLGLLALFARLCLKPFIRGRAGDCLTLLLICAYLWLAGPRPSLVRAGLMYAGYTLFSLRDRKPGLLALLSFSFVLSAVFFPGDLHSLSFILSYLAMLGILLGTTVCRRFLMRWTPGILASPLAVSLAAQAAVSPLLLARFGFVSPGGIPASLGLGPLVTAFMGTGILTCLCAVLPAPLAYPLSRAASFAMNLLYAAIRLVVELCARIPPLPPWS